MGEHIDKMNEKLYQENIDLVDKNKYLENQLLLLQKRIDQAIEHIEKHIEDKKYLNNIYSDKSMLEMILEILKGEDNFFIKDRLVISSKEALEDVEIVEWEKNK